MQISQQVRSSIWPRMLRNSEDCCDNNSRYWFVATLSSRISCKNVHLWISRVGGVDVLLFNSWSGLRYLWWDSERNVQESAGVPLRNTILLIKYFQARINLCLFIHSISFRGTTSQSPSADVGKSGVQVRRCVINLRDMIMLIRSDLRRGGGQLSPEL